MTDLSGWAIYAWIALPTVMYGGYALLRLLARDEASSFRRTWFRAGHAHAGVLLLALLLFVDYMARTSLPGWLQHLACGVFVGGIIAQSGGFFIHMVRGSEGMTSIGTTITSLGGVLLTLAIAVLVVGLFGVR